MITLLFIACLLLTAATAAIYLIGVALSQLKSPLSPAKRKLKTASIVVLLVSIPAATWLILLQVGYIGENFYVVSANTCYRSAQMSATALEKHVAENGIKTVINLRGVSKAAWHAQESEMLKKLSVGMEDIGFDTERLPKPENVVHLLDSFKNAPRPILLHCNHGVDRTGLAAVLFKTVVEKEPLETAIAAQNTVLTGHIATPRNDAGDRFLDLYENSKANLSIEEWSRTVYPTLYASMSPKNGRDVSNRSWLNSPMRIGSLVLTPFKALGILGASLFACRWFVQAYSSKRAGRPVTPLNFWLISIAGSVLMLTYFTFSAKQDIVGIISNLFPALVSGYNVFLELRFRARERLARKTIPAAASSPSAS